MSKIPTKNFFFGMKLREETMIELGEGKNMVCELQSIGPADEDGRRTLFFRVNGQTRNIKVIDKSLNIVRKEHLKADKVNPLHMGAPLQGLLSNVFVKEGQRVTKNQPLFVIEAMKMETTVIAPNDLTIRRCVLSAGTLVEADDLVLSYEE
jgi:pyruvate carboxylase